MRRTKFFGPMMGLSVGASLFGCIAASPSPQSEIPPATSRAVVAPSASTSAKAPSDEAPLIATTDTEDLVVGTGAVAEVGKRVSMYYIGRLQNGTEFDRTLRRPFEFQLGAGEVIKGWDEGIPGMRVGGKRRLVIPGELAYGARGLPPTIPPNATLVFEVELLDVL